MAVELKLTVGLLFDAVGGGTGVTEPLDADDAPVPTLLVAVTENV